MYWTTRHNLLVLLVVVGTGTLLVRDVEAAPIAQVRVKGAHFVGIPSVVSVLVKGLEVEPEPNLRQPETSAGVQAVVAGVFPRISQNIQIINGRTTSHRSVIYEFHLQVVADEAGRYTVGPFYVEQGSTEVAHPAVELEFEEITEDEDVRIEIVLPERAVFPGERVPVAVRWWYGGERGPIHGLSIRSQLFDRFDFVDKEPQRRDSLLPIQTAEGIMRLKADVTEETWQERDYVVYTAKRMMIPDKPGEYEFGPAVATREKITSWGRDFFGERVPKETAPTKSLGQPIRLIVRPYPMEGRPDSFADAVGNGFSIEVAADRTVVRVGDPIGLLIRVRGQGNLEHISLPPLDVDGGMLADQFRIPTGDIAGTFEDGVKQFRVSVRVLDASVQEIPAVAFSWFDTESGTYQTTHSAPIALRVEEAQLITAHDVVSSTDPQSSLTGSSEPLVSTDPDENQETTSTTPARLSAFDVDLSIEVDTQRLLSSQQIPLYESVSQGVCYLGGLALFTFAVWDRQRRQIDPGVTERRRLMKENHRRIRATAEMSSRDAAKQIADALRVIGSGATVEQRSKIEPLIAQCEEIVYVPQGENGDQLPSDLMAAADRIANEILQET